MSVLVLKVVCADLVYIASLASIVEHHGNSFPGDERREAKLNHNGGL